MEIVSSSSSPVLFFHISSIPWVSFTGFNINMMRETISFTSLQAANIYSSR
ncbi:CatA-like O-acetyltransferase [Metabacillus idriensis]|uniref:CatA-like O-acetyltransferase n=1 Tax=Metabacillus idriensis TaxID=324768 RepID=UPI001CD48DD7